MSDTPIEKRVAELIEPHQHDFKEEYYGWRCSKCGQFYPNTAPLEAWLLGEPKNPCPHEPVGIANNEGLLDCVKCRYCGEVLLP